MNKKLLAKLALKALQDHQSLKGKEGYDAETEAALQADYDAKKLAVEEEDRKAAGGKDEATIAIEDIKTIVAETVNVALVEFSKGLAKPVTADAIKGIVETAINERMANVKEVKAPDAKSVVGAIVQDVLNAAMNNIRKESKSAPLNRDDGAQRDHNVIELTVSWSKGNLPLHGKQLLNILMHRPANEGVTAEQVAEGIKLGEKTISDMQGLARQLSTGQKAMTSTGSATGDELVPRDLSSELQRRLYIESNIAAMFAATEINMPTNPYDLPIHTTDPTFYKGSSENTATTASDVGTGLGTLTAVKIMGEVDYSYELDEDSLIPVLPLITGALSRGAARALEDAVINGDTTATHMDSDYETVATHAARSWKGFRRLSLGVAGCYKDISSGGISEANLRAMKKLMGKYGRNLKDLMWVVGPMGENDMLAITNVASVDKFGPGATVLSGVLPTFMGIPIVTSEQGRENLNASGVYDNSTTTKGSIILVNKSRWLMGRRRDFTVETFRDVQKQMNIIVASFRRAFIPIETPSATVPSLCIGYNYTA